MKYTTLFLVQILFAAKPMFDFDDPAMQVRFDSNLAQYRCLVCQNESLLDSQAPLAMDLRKQIYIMLKSGKSDNDIKQVMIAHYGDFIQLSPPINTHTGFLWIMPLLMLLIWLIRLRFSR